MGIRVHWINFYRNYSPYIVAIIHLAAFYYIP